MTVPNKAPPHKFSTLNQGKWWTILKNDSVLGIHLFQITGLGLMFKVEPGSSQALQKQLQLKFLVLEESYKVIIDQRHN